jgi:nitrite reductase/ring-hydroxylating ferredoxin subunit
MADVASFADLNEGEPTVATVGRCQIVLVRWRGQVFALRNVCPHQAQSFQGGCVRRQIIGNSVPGRIGVREYEPVLVCPWHSWRFSLVDGRAISDRSKRVRAYATTLHDGRVIVNGVE